MKIYLLRHGETDWNKQDRMAYNKNLVLNDDGIKQAEAVAQEIEKLDYDLVLSSPFIRARQTAEIANKKQCPIIIDERLAERGHGVLDGIELYKVDLDEFFNYYKNIEYEGAEDLQEFCNRVWSFLDDIKIKYKDKSILIVTHNVVIRAIKAYIIGMPKDGNINNYGIKNCGLEEYELT